MTKKEFQQKYHYYAAETMQEAEQEAARANAQGIDGDKAVTLALPPFGFAVMLESTKIYLERMGIPRP